MEQNNSEKPQEIANNKMGTEDNAAENPQTQENINTSEKSDADKSVNTEEKSSENKKSESPAAQDATHTATTAMSESMPMSGINGKKIFKTLFKNIVLLALSAVFALTIFFVYKISADSGNNIIAMIRTGEFYENAMLFFLPENSTLAEEYRRRAVERYMEEDKKIQDQVYTEIVKAVNYQAELYSNEKVISRLIESNRLASLFPNSPKSLLILADNLQKNEKIENCDETVRLLRKAEQASETNSESDEDISLVQYLLGRLYHDGQCVSKDAAKAEELFKKSAEKGFIRAKTNYGIYLFKHGNEEKEKGNKDLSMKYYKQAFKTLKEPAENGESKAQVLLGHIYLDEKEIFESSNPIVKFLNKFFNRNKDFKRIEKGNYWLRRAASSGEETAFNILASNYVIQYGNWKICKLKGNCHEEDFDFLEAEKWVKKAYLSGDKKYLFPLADLYYNNPDIYNVSKGLLGVNMMKQAAETGDEAAKIHLAQFYSYGNFFIKKDIFKAKQLIEDLKDSEQFKKSTKSILANIYFNDDKDYKEAFNLYKEVNSDYSRLEIIFSIYKHAQKEDKDLKKEIISYVEDEIKKGHYPSDRAVKNLLLQQLGIFYLKGDDVISKDYEKSARYFKICAADDNDYCQESLAELYEQGKGVAQDKKKAEKLYAQAADQDSYSAMFHLGKMYYNLAISNKNVSEKNMYFSKSLSWLQKSLDKNFDAKTSNLIGLMYYKGYGTRQDYVKAIEYFKKGYADKLTNWDYDMQKVLNGIISCGSHVNCYQKSFAKEYTDISSALGFIKYFIIDNTDTPDIIKKLEQERDNGNSQAQELLDAKAKYGSVLKYEAIEFIKSAAENGDKDAKYLLEEVISQKDGGMSVYKKWIEKSARHGNGYSKALLGEIYEEGKITDKDEKKALECYKKSAKQGNPEGQYRLGMMYLNGKITGITEYREAEKWFAKAAEKGHFPALAEAIIIESIIPIYDGTKTADLEIKYKKDIPNNLDYAIKEKGKHNYIKSFIFSDVLTNLDKSLSLGFLPAYLQLGIYAYSNKKIDDALAFWNKASEKGSCLAASMAAATYGEMKQWDKAEKEGKKAINMNKVSSECIEMFNDILALTEFYKTGVVENEYQKILANYAKKGSLISQTALGNLYHDAAEKKSKNSNKSSDINKLYKKAVYWYEKSIKQSPLNPDMSYTLAKIYSNDKVWAWHQKLFGRNYKKAFKYYLEAAKQYPEAQEILGKMYYEGKGVNQNYYKATEWLRKAADSNRKEAQYMLGEMYENAQGVYMNTEEAFYWYKKAAEEQKTEETAEEAKNSMLTEVAPLDKETNQKEKAHNAEFRAKAQFRLGQIYEEGRREIKQDLAEARKLYSKAAAQGHKEAQAALERLGKR